MANRTEKIASTFLGKSIKGSEFYNPSLLVAIPRSENREQYEINCKELPFQGWDIWHAYEFSSITVNGIPVTRLLKIKYNCESEFIIESKSLKLYLNSFNMSQNGKTINDCLDICKSTIERDLSKKLQTAVTANFIDNNTQRVEIFNNYENIITKINQKTLKIENYKESPELIVVENLDTPQKYCLMFDSLRSNCRVTHQPDFGDVFIYYKSNKHILEDSLVKYLSSFRSEYHFHEECCEMIFKRIYDLLDNEDELFVCALYTRRGGIDICPVRKTKNCTIEDDIDLIDVTKYARSGIKQ